MSDDGLITEKKIGDRLREIRTSKRLSLADVAARSGLSTSFISNVERGVNDPTIGSLQSLLAALDLTLTDLFRSADQGQTVVRREEQREMVRSTDGRVRYQLVTPPGERRIEALLLTVQPGGESGPVSHAHGGVEVGVILKGQLRYWLEDQMYDLREGDTITYDGRRSHRYANTSDAECISLWVLAQVSS